jgi:hypothetical protein
MARQLRFGQGLSEKIPKGPAIVVLAIRPPGFRSSLVLSAFRHRALCGRSSVPFIMCLV